MQVLLVLVGVRGAGKSTVLDALRKNAAFRVLTPSTTRKPRSTGDSEYFFMDEGMWKSASMAWEVPVGGYRYGMSRSQIEAIPTQSCGLTVFDPSSLGVLQAYRETSKVEIVTVGLDTIGAVDEQDQRVGSDVKRKLTPTQFETECKVVRDCDVVLRGPAESVQDAVEALGRLLLGRGGIVDSRTLSSLVRAGTLLLGANPSNISTASCDLLLGDVLWCQGKHTTLSESNPTVSVPAHSYAIVSAKETAEIPKFMAGRFDLKLSLFFEGVILSNGPQVDPGYKGALFCLLFNGNDLPVGITRGSHFATIEFCTTARTTRGYAGNHQGMSRLSDFLPQNAAVSKGGQIFERLNALEGTFRAEWNTTRNGFLTLLGIGVAIISIFSVLFINMRNEVKEALRDLRALSEQIKPNNEPREPRQSPVGSTPSKEADPRELSPLPPPAGDSAPRVH